MREKQFSRFLSILPAVIPCIDRRSICSSCPRELAAELSEPTRTKCALLSADPDFEHRARATPVLAVTETMTFSPASNSSFCNLTLR